LPEHVYEPVVAALLVGVGGEPFTEIIKLEALV
jgi:hypothetical protein